MMSVKWSLSVWAGLGFLLLCEGQQENTKTTKTHGLVILHKNTATSCICNDTLEKNRNPQQVDVCLQYNGSCQSAGRNVDCLIIKHSTCKSNNKAGCCVIEELPRDTDSVNVGGNDASILVAVRNDTAETATSSTVKQHTTSTLQSRKKVFGKGMINQGRTVPSSTATSSISKRHFTSTLQPQRNLSGRRANKLKGRMPQIWAFLTGILIGIVIGVAATSVACCCLAKSIADCRKRTCNNACHCCRTDNHVTVTQSSESAGPTLSRRDLAVQDVSIYNEAEDINTPRVGRRPVSDHPYEKIQVRHDPSQYDIINNGIHGPIASGVHSCANKKNKEPTRSNEDSIELKEIAKNKDENLQAMSTDAKNTAIDKASTSIENTVVRNSSPFYFTLVKMESAIADSPGTFKPIHIDDDIQCPEVDRPYFILEKENADTEIKGVSNTTDNMTDGKSADADECSKTNASENKTVPIIVGVA